MGTGTGGGGGVERERVMENGVSSEWFTIYILR